jgi:hypothetical protein
LWGEGHTRLRERVEGVPIPTRGHTLWYSLYIRVRTLWICRIEVKKSNKGQNKKWEGKDEHGAGSRYPRWGKTVHVVF